MQRPIPQRPIQRQGRRPQSWRQLVLGLGAWLLMGAGCVTQGDFLRLQEQVADHHQSRENEPDPFARIAELSADVDALRQQIVDLRGEVELARKQASDALAEVQRTRTALARGETPEAPEAEAVTEAAEGSLAAAPSDEGQSARDAELAGYQTALDAWRTEDFDSCIDRFTVFLQRHPTSGYADDAAYWLADCTYKKNDFKRAVVRFNAVVSVYPESPKAADALYRQGESLLKLGPKFHEAARTVFKRVQKDYPSSERAVEAAQQLDRLGAGSDSRG